MCYILNQQRTDGANADADAEEGKLTGLWPTVCVWPLAANYQCGGLQGSLEDSMRNLHLFDAYRLIGGTLAAKEYTP